MNLFQHETQDILEKFVSKDWAEQLSQHIDIETFKGIGKKVTYLRQTNLIYPEPQSVFKALKYDFTRVKVVIVGQDPYHNGNADGLAFSCRNTLSPSLSMILNAIWTDLFKLDSKPVNDRITETNFYRSYISNKNNWNLEYLAEQGVLLYNPTLTVEAGKPNSHKGVWDKFTEAVLKSIINIPNVVVMTWGNDAINSFHKVIGTQEDKILQLKNEHPAAASYRNDIWKCNHFTECNKWLRDRNLTEIEWIQR